MAAGSRSTGVQARRLWATEAHFVGFRPLTGRLNFEKVGKDIKGLRARQPRMRLLYFSPLLSSTPKTRNALGLCSPNHSQNNGWLGGVYVRNLHLRFGNVLSRLKKSDAAQWDRTEGCAPGPQRKRDIQGLGRPRHARQKLQPALQSVR